MAGGAFESNTRTIAGMLAGLPCWRTTGILLSSMDQFTYERIRKRRPDLQLTSWLFLSNTGRHRMKRFSPDAFIARATAEQLAGHVSNLWTGVKYKRAINSPHTVPF